MASYDLIDSVLEIGDNDLSNGFFAARFGEFYMRHFSPYGLRFNGARFIYMLYGAILSLPLTKKISNHDIDGLLVAKKGNNLKLIISYKTPDDTRSLSLKLLSFDGSVLPSIPFAEQSIILDAQRLLSFVKKRRVDQSELKTALDQIHEITFQYETEQKFLRVRPKITSIPYCVDQALMNSHFEFPELLLLQQSPYAKSASIFMKQLQSDVYDVVRYNCHEFTKLLILQHLISAQSVQLSMNLKDMHLFLIGALEMNWARSHRLKIYPIFETSGNIISGLIVNHYPSQKLWKSESSPFVVQLLTSDPQPSHETYAANMYSRMVEGLPHIQSKKIVVIGVDHNRLLEISKQLISIPASQLFSFTFLLDLNPMENLVDLLLEPFSQTTLPKMNYCIRNLNLRGKYGLHAYLYGQLMSYKKYDIEKYVYQSSATPQGTTTFAFKLRGTDTGVLFNIVQTSSASEAVSAGNIKLNIKLLLQITVYQMYEMNDNDHIKVHLMRSHAQFVDNANLPRGETEGDWWLISTVNPDDVLLDIERRPESFDQLTNSDTLHIMFDSIENTLLRLQDRMSFQDIVHFVSGIFSGWKKIFYYGFVGILKSDGSPVFISTLQTSHGDQVQLVGEKMKEISIKYVRRDYISNALRRIASFVCITHTSSENGNRFGIVRLSTYGQHKSTFESCLPGSNVRVKRKSLLNIPCLDDESSESHEELSKRIQSDTLLEEKLPPPVKAVHIKTQQHLETVSKVSKVIMTAQIFKDMVGALIRGDYKTFAVNTAFLASGPLLECLSMKMIAKGVSLDGSLLGRSLLISAPFLSRLPIMGFVGFDLYEQVKAYKNGNKGAMVNIAGDSTILTIDFATAGIEGAEALGLISGVADIAGPIGLAIGTAIFVGVDIYNSVKAVSNIDAMVHLTGWQKFTTGLLSFLHVSPTKTVQEEIFERTIADASIDNAAKFFKNYSSVKYYIFPSYQENGDFVENNIIDLTKNATRLAHSWPKNVADTKLICAGNSDLQASKTSRLLLNCSNSFGYESASKDDIAVILMGHGNDTVRTFRRKPTTFLIGNGHKFIVGSSEDDIFIFDGNYTTGYINGKLGKNLINLANFAQKRPIEINFLKRRLTYSGRKVKMSHIHSAIGRPLAKEMVLCNCHTHYLDTQGGSAAYPDLVILEKDCPYDTTIRINGTIKVKNEAIRGSFTYIFSQSFTTMVSFGCATDASHHFVFEQQNLEDLFELHAVHLDNASLCHNLTFKSKDSTLKLDNIHHNAVYMFKDQSELKINNGTVSISLFTNETVTNIYEKYVLLSKKLNAVISVYSKLDNVSLLFGGGMAIHRGASRDNSNHINILPNDPNHETYLVGGENQNVFRISMKHFHNTTVCSLKRMPAVTIIDYAKNDYVNVIDLFEIILLIHEQFLGQVMIKMDSQDSDLLMRIYAQCPNGSMTNIINITLDGALANQNYEHLVVNMRRPMTIRLAENATLLIPADYHVRNETYTIIHSGLVEPNTTLVSPKVLGNYDIITYNSTNLILTNLKYTKMNESDLIFMIFKDFFHFNELRTLRLQFSDRLVELSQEIDEVHSEFQDFEDFLAEETERYSIAYNE